MKIYFFIYIVFFLAFSAYSQNTPKLEKSVASKMQASVSDLINSYKEKLNKIGSKSIDGNKKMVIVQETFQLFENKDVRVFNNIDATGKKPSDPKISTYLEDIYVLYNKEGVSFNFDNIKLSDIYISRNFDYFFIKASIDINAFGTTNNGEKLNSGITQDIFVQYKFSGQIISPEPSISGIFKSPVPTDGFVKPEIVDNGTIPQPFTFGKKWENINPNAANELKESTKKWIVNYYTNLNTLGSKQYDVMKKGLLTQEIIEQFESEGVIVYYDIDPTMGDKATSAEIETYLGDIVTLYGKDGISFQNTEPIISELYISRNNKFLFQIASVDRTVNGTDNSGKSINYKTKLNFVVQYNISDSIVKRKPIITTITDQQLTTNNFIKINSNEVANAPNKLVLEPSDEEVKAILDKTKQNEENNKKMAEEYNKKIQEQQLEKERAEREKATQELEKKKLLWEQNNINKYFDGWDNKLLVKFYPLRLLMGSTQFSVEKGLKNTGRNISVEQTLGIWKGMKPALFPYDSPDNSMFKTSTGDKNPTFSGFTLRTEFRFYLKPNTLYGKYFSVQFYYDRMTWSVNNPEQEVYNIEGSPFLTVNGTTYDWIVVQSDKYDALRTHIGIMLYYGIQRKIYRSKFTFDFYIGIGFKQQTITRDFKNSVATGYIHWQDPNNYWNYTNTPTVLTDYPYLHTVYTATGSTADMHRSVKYYPDMRIACKFGYRFGQRKLD